MDKLIVDVKGNISIKYSDGLEYPILWSDQLEFEKSVFHFFYKCEKMGFDFITAFTIYKQAKEVKK